MRVTLLSLWTSTCLTAAVGLSLSSSDPNFPMQRNLTKTLAGTNAPSKILNQSGIGEDQLDFILKFKGQHVSLKTLLQKLLKSNASVTLPVNKQFFLEKVADQKNSSQQSCQGRCFIEERSDAVMSCYCDKDCKKWGDCCWDFKTRCAEIIGDSFTDSMTCGNINDHSWSGVLMKSICELNNEYTSDCKNVEHLSLSIQRELPVFDAQNNITYRSIACARCNNADRERLIPWGLRVTCPDQRTKLPQDKNITTIKTFLKDKCSWNYEPTVNLSRIFKSCVVRDTLCHSSTQFSGLTLVKELCSSYSMLFSVKASQYVTHFYRNPHCAICNPQGKQFGKNEDGDDDEGPILPPLGPPLSVLLDISSETFIIEKKPQVTHPSILTNHSFEAKNSSVLFEGKKCFIIGSAEVNQSSTLHLNRGVVHMPSYKVGLQHVYGNFVSVLCPTGEGKPRKLEDEIYITFIGSILSIISLLFLVAVYMSFKELRNLPGKCLVSLSSALVCYQIIFRLSAVSKDVEGLCKAVAICLHFFFLAAFSWMSVIAFDTANTFKVQVKDPRKQACDIKKTFIKYCILGWGVPIAIVVSCVTLDYTGAVEFGYGNHSQYCGISDRIAIAVTMVTPVSLALVFNVVCLTKSVCTIYHLQKGSGQVLSSSSRVPLLLICFKLTTIMGLTWILTLVANWEQASFLQYPATVLNSLQGFIIMMCFITTKRVRSLIREKFCKRSSRAQAKQGTTPDVTTFGCHQAQFRTRCQRNSADNQEKTA